MVVTTRVRPRLTALGRRLRPIATAIGIVLIAANLRPALSSVATLLPQLGLSGGAAGVLNAVPVVMFGLGAPAAPILARRIGMERTLFLALVLLAAGLLVRIGPSPATLFGGTILLGAAIAVANVLLPALVKRDFPNRIGLMSGLYTTALSAVAAFAAGTSLPLAEALGHGWRGGLGIWTLPVLIALIAWLPLLRARHSTVPGADVPAGNDGSLRRILRSHLAWKFTIFFGSQGLVYHAILAWLPSIYQAQGISPASSGALLSLATLIALPVSLVLPSLAARAADQRGWVIGLTALTATGLAGLLIAPAGAPYAWAVLIGLGMGATFPLTLTLIALRTRTDREAADLSTMANTAGFLIAGLGPLAMGVLHAATGSWTPTVAILLVVLVPQVLTGLAAGRDRTI